jgi:predicted aldo/keto reductase-like oxidoreductase
MEYRKLGRTGLNVSAIGLGTEHLWEVEGVFRAAVDAGVNYVDVLHSSAEGFDPESSDVNFWSILRRHRDKLILAAHWSYLDDYNESNRLFEGVLRVLGGYAEVGLIQNGGTERTKDGRLPEELEYMLRLKEQGRIGYIGISNHYTSSPIEIANSGLVDVLMVQISLMDLINGSSEGIREMCQACVKQGVGLVAMKPYWGGNLFSHQGKPSGITATQCLAYVLSHPVSTTVPGVSTVKHLQEALYYLEATDEEKEYRSIIENIPTAWQGQCVYCNHCLPCPLDIT